MGYFWFFDEDNVEIVIKVFDVCSFVNSFWVFVGGLMNVEVDFVVIDVVMGMECMYSNFQGSVFWLVQDMGVFFICGVNGCFILWS